MTRGSLPPLEERPAIEVRNLDFELPAEPRHWHSGNPFITHFFNGLSIMFPDGERFFMDAVRHFEVRIDDPVLRTQVKGFLGQEALHGREHRHYNEMLAAQGYPVGALERHVRRMVDLDRKFPVLDQLATTCALEHFTAIMADIVLRDPAIFADAHPKYARLWRWHALEESEHKAVAFDVYRAMTGGLGGYLRRVIVMLMTTLLFGLEVLVFQLILVGRDRRLFDLRAWREAIRFFWLRPGFLRRSLRAYLSYYRPSFHPWQHDNSRVVARWKDEYATG